MKITPKLIKKIPKIKHPKNQFSPPIVRFQQKMNICRLVTFVGGLKPN
jgi:hypothetical protein